jgi:hypothetical protein
MRSAEDGLENPSGTPQRSGLHVEIEPVNWDPLEMHIGSRCAEFMWMYRENGREHYKHIDTRQYLILDSRGGCYRSQGTELVRVDFQDEFQRVTEAFNA